MTHARKDLLPSDRVAIAIAVELRLGERRGNGNVDNDPELKGIFTKEIAAREAGFGNHETLRQAKAVVATNDTDLIAAMDSGALSINAASKAAALPPVARKEVIESANPKRKLREIGTMTDRQNLAGSLHDIADRLERLMPSHSNTFRFHEEKSELVEELRRLASGGQNLATRSAANDNPSLLASAA
jgi:hypothetical protein